MTKSPWTIGTILLALVAASSMAPVATSGGGSDAANREEYELLRATQDVFRDVAQRVRPFLVKIETVGGSQPPARILPTEEDEDATPLERDPNLFRDAPGSRFVVSDGPTTGLVYRSDGYILTSSFNFVREPILISVTLGDGRRLAADLIARDQVRKIALLKVDATDLPVPQWLAPGHVRVGQWAIALGLGFGGDRPSVTIGIVSALQRMKHNAIQTDAKLSPANYGGPLCDIHGRIIGLCVPMAQRPGELAGVEMYDSGIGFAVPKNRVDAIAEYLMTGRSFYRGWLGMQSDPHGSGGAKIAKIASPSPLEEAGVQVGDVIVRAEGKPIRNLGQLVQAIYMLPAGETVHLGLERGGEAYGVLVTLARNTELGSFPDETP
ncbi:MAG: trypsin-like peptidase domain-containing protein [Planctomycetes bacterium]|nr:trypsin-like peptidase domain-containing protein [Planctomycetota bacterium]